MSPWLILLGEQGEQTLALWRLAETPADALALFASQELAECYAEAHCPAPFRTVLMEQSPLLQVLIDCHRQGIQFAVLNPSQTASSRLFKIRDILKSARESLSAERRERQ